jgi:hypothetical protein
MSHCSIPVRLLMRISLLTVLTISSACFDEDKYRSPTESGNSFLRLSTESDLNSLPADGVSRLTLVATITSDAAVGRRTVKFKTTSGTLIGPGTNPLEQDVEVNQAGQARIQLQSAKQVGTALVTAEVSLGSAAGSGKLVERKEVAFTAPNVNEIIRFVRAPRTTPADGASPSRFTVEVSDGIPLAQRSVTFATTAGSFKLGATPVQETIISLGANRQATVTLFSPLELGNADVSAKINDFRSATVIQFVHAPAERIFISLDKPSVKNAPDQKIAITATLDRTVGIPTKDTQVFFRVTDKTGAETGYLLQSGYLSNAEGKATAEYTPAGVATPGRATVTVTVAGSPARDEANFEIVPP